MSTGKRLAKRSILGTRVCVPLEDGLYVPGVIQATKTDASDHESIYCVLLEDKTTREYKCTELIGPGFQSVTNVVLKAGQKVFVTYNGREVAGKVLSQHSENDEILICIQSSYQNSERNSNCLEVTKKLDELRLMECRKSARLQDLDTDYSRLADGQSEPRRRASSLSIEVPVNSSCRKRRSSAEDNVMDDCMAAMVLMSLSCSPKSSRLSEAGTYSRSWASGSSWSSTYSPTQSPPSPSSHQSEVDSTTDAKFSGRCSPSQDEGIELDETVGFLDDALPTKEKVARVVFQCTWPGCTKQYDVCEDIERHVCITHLGRNNVGETDHEEEFYYTEVEIEDADSQHIPLSPTTANGTNIYSSSVPTLSHLDMARPPHEDPEYKRQGPVPLLDALSGPVNIPPPSYPVSWHLHGYAASAPTSTGSSPQKFMRLSSKPTSSPHKGSLHRKGRSESRKCRKVYGMDNREAWCTQCKWKKACSRFVD